MKKAILNEAIRPQVIHRIMKLQPGSNPLWGSFTVGEMMFHCTAIQNAILLNQKNSHTPTMKQRFLRTMVLRGMKQLPKGITTNPKYLKPKEDKPLFEEERKRLIESVNKVADRKENIYGTHPMLGPLDTMKWRRFIYMHLDHHLRQFDV